MIRRVFLGAVAAAAIACAQVADARWLEAQTEHFTIYTDQSESAARAYATQLERFDHLLREMANLPTVPQSKNDKVTVFLVPFGTVQSLAHSRMVGGFYNGDIQSTLAVMPLSLPDGVDADPFEIMFHEYTHHIFISSTEVSYPSWLKEGLAEFFGTTRFRSDGTIVIGAPPQMRGYALHRDMQMSLEELLDSDGKRLTEQEIEDKYARGWLLTHYLLLSGERPKQYDAYLASIASGASPLEAGRRAFGDLHKLDGELVRYNRTGKFQAFAIPATFAPPAAQVRALNECQADIMPVRMRSAVGVNEKMAPDLVGPARAVAARCAGEAFVQRALAEVEFDAKNNSEAMVAADRALKADPNNLMAMVYKGRVYARQANWDEARKWFINANHVDPNYALPLVLYYDTYRHAGAKPSAAAVTALMRAIVLAPQADDLRLRVAYQLIEEGDLSLARKILTAVAYTAHGNGENKALEVIKKIDAKAATAEVLAAAKAAKWDQIGSE